MDHRFSIIRDNMMCMCLTDVLRNLPIRYLQMTWKSAFVLFFFQFLRTVDLAKSIINQMNDAMEQEPQERSNLGVSHAVYAKAHKEVHSSPFPNFYDFTHRVAHKTPNAYYWIRVIAHRACVIIRLWNRINNECTHLSFTKNSW